jgi:hypothetical protein
MAREYPRSTATKERAWAKLPEHEGPRCTICGRKALFKVVVEVSWFRGDDEVFKACDEHRSHHAQALLDAKAAGVAVLGEAQPCLSSDGLPNHCVMWKCHDAKACARGVTVLDSQKLTPPTPASEGKAK